MPQCGCSLPWAKNTPSVTSRLNRSITAGLSLCFHASVRVLPSLSQKHTKCNISPKSVYHGSPKQSFEPFLPSEVCEQRLIKNVIVWPNEVAYMYLFGHWSSDKNSSQQNHPSLLNDICDLFSFYQNLLNVWSPCCGIKVLSLSLMDSLILLDLGEAWWLSKKSIGI